MVSWHYKGRTDESWSEFLILDDSTPFRFSEICRGLCFSKSSFRAGISSTVTHPSIPVQDGTGLQTELWGKLIWSDASSSRLVPKGDHHPGSGLRPSVLAPDRLRIKSYLSLSKSMNLHNPQFSHLWNGNTFHTLMMQRDNKCKAFSPGPDTEKALSKCHFEAVCIISRPRLRIHYISVFIIHNTLY